jgi:hypothetical protein
MTPKQHAYQLVTTYSRRLPANQTTLLDHKNCALAAVDEIIEFMKMDDEYTETASNANSKWVEYWKEVQAEIDKMA